MLSSNNLAVDIGSGNIKLLYGNKNRIAKVGLIKTPTDSVVDNKIVDLEAISSAIGNYLQEKKIKAKNICFAIHGQDIVIRHLDIPIIDEKSLRQAVEWEINQNLPDNGANYYLDYQILNKVNNSDKKMFKVLAVSAPSDKIDKYIELCKMLDLNIKAIDISANCAARVFKKNAKIKGGNKSVGIIDLGSKSSEIIIVENGMLYMEREVPFGIENLVREINRRINNEEISGIDYLLNKFNFKELYEDNEVDNRIKSLLDNVLTSFQKVIQFYATGKTQKNLDEIYLIGRGSEIKGLSEYITYFLNSPTSVVNAPEQIKSKVKMPKGSDFKDYISTLGLLLRKE